uniref:Uncharacterized protein n=1 Tax=Acrobeloides nanus TaxID=290746 RepID=A0A914CPC2_9BILA
MGLWLLVFRHEEWKRIYSDNCSLRTAEEWNSEGSPSINIPIGIVYIVVGVIYQMLFQSMAICVELFVVAVVYVGNQFYPVPELVVKIEHLTWISVHGN